MSKTCFYNSLRKVWGYKQSEKNSNICYTFAGNPIKACKSYQGYSSGSYFDNTHGTYGWAYGSRDSYPTQAVCQQHGYTLSGNKCSKTINATME